MLRLTNIDQVYASCIREYMKGVDRSNRKYKTQEVFTPDWMVDMILDELSEFDVCDSVVIDRAAGDGQFLSKVLIKKILYLQKNGFELHDAFVKSLDSIFGVDIELENVILCRSRLLCGCTDPKVIDLINRRIIVGDSLNPKKRIPSQTDSDYNLMVKYFSTPFVFEEIA